MITSVDNAQLKNIRQLLERPSARRKSSLFVVEGVRMFLEAPTHLIEKVYACEDFMKRSIHAGRVRELPYEIVADAVFKRISDTRTPQGVLLLVRMPVYEESRLKERYGSGRFLILNRIQDPGNIGTMIRTAEAAGMAGVIMDRECADIFNPKVIRSTMGSIFRVPFIISEELPALIDRMKKGGVRMVAGDLGGEIFYKKPAIDGGVGILIGNEGGGLTKELIDKADMRLRIPMEGKVSSLNAAVSAALLMYEFYKP